MKMKDKKAEQIELKSRHKEQLKINRRTEPTFDRPEPKLTEKLTILIICEGKIPSFHTLNNLDSHWQQLNQLVRGIIQYHL